jgi:hypothetical protein
MRLRLDDFGKLITQPDAGLIGGVSGQLHASTLLTAMASDGAADWLGEPQERHQPSP